MSEKSHKKYQHEECNVLLDDCFCNDDVAEILTAGGFVLEELTKHFPRQAGKIGAREQGVKDPRVIALPHKLRMVVFTTDHRMRDDHRAGFLKNTDAMVVTTTHKSLSDEEWAHAFVKAKQKIKNLHKNSAARGSLRLTNTETSPSARRSPPVSNDG